MDRDQDWHQAANEQTRIHDHKTHHRQQQEPTEVRTRGVDGPGDAWSPEHLLLAAVETCFLFTLRAVARASRVDFTACDVTAEGTVDRADGAIRFTEIVLRPRLRLAPGTDPDRARRAMEKDACLVSASLATPIRLEAELA